MTSNNVAIQRFALKKAPASALGQDLVPTVSVDTGARVTGIVVRVGVALAAHTVVVNPEQSGQAHTPGMDPANRYAETVNITLDAMVVACRAAAVAWWARKGFDLGLDEDPFLYAAEKVNNPRAARNDREAETFDNVEFAGGSIATARGVFGALQGHVGFGRLMWTCPWEADTRWQDNREHGTGDPHDFYPTPLLAGVRPVPAGVVYPSQCLDVPTPHGGRVKDLCAAWSVSTDAAQAYEAACRQDRATGRRVVPPSRAPHVILKASPSAVGGTVTPINPVIVYANNLTGSPRTTAAATAQSVRTDLSLDGVDPFRSPAA